MELSLAAISMLLNVIGGVATILSIGFAFLYRRTVVNERDAQERAAANERALNEFKLQTIEKLSHKADVSEVQSWIKDLGDRLEAKMDGLGDRIYELRGQTVD